MKNLLNKIKPDNTSLIKRIVMIILYALFFVMLLIIVTPASPILLGGGLDPSWNYVLSHAYNNNFLFGKDIYFTYGPLGIFNFPHYIFHEKTFGSAMFIAVYLISFIFLGFVHLVRKLSVSLKSIVFFSIIWALIIAGTNLWFLLPLILIGLFFDPIKTPEINAVAIFHVLFFLAFSVLVKFSYLITAVFSVLLIDIYRGYKEKHYFPMYSIGFALCTFLLFILAKQDPTYFFDYIYGSLQTVTGYSESMQTRGPLWEVFYYIVIAIVLFASFFNKFLLRDLFRNLTIYLSLLALLFISFKNGFVRHDGHALQAFSGLCFVLGFIPVFFVHVLTNSVIHKRIFYFSFLFTIFGATLIYSNYRTHNSKLATFSIINSHINVLSENLIKTLNFNERRTELTNINSASKERIKNNVSIGLNVVDGTIDVYPWDQAIVLAHDLQYHPRPLFQSYSAYTEYLLINNREHLIGENAPEYLLFSVGEIDGRLPSLMDGASWLDIVEHYEIIDMDYEYILFKRSNNKRPYILHDFKEEKVKWNESYLIPEEELFAQFEIKKTLLGKLLNFLFKSPKVSIEFNFKNGTSTSYRLIPGMSKSGIVLSPVITNSQEFALFGLREKEENMPISFMIKVNYKYFYRKSIKVKLKKIDIKSNDTFNEVEKSILNTIQELKKSENVMLNILHHEENRTKVGDYFNLTTYNNQAVLFSHTGTSFFAHVDNFYDNKEQIKDKRIYFGMFENAYKGQNKTEGACFNLYHIDDKENISLVYNKCIDPLQVPDDRGEHEIILNKQEYTEGKFLFEVRTRDGHTANWGWAYWKL